MTGERHLIELDSGRAMHVDRVDRPANGVYSLLTRPFFRLMVLSRT